MTHELDPIRHAWARHERVILFDGVCRWCNAWVNLVLVRDPHGRFKFGTLQSEPAQRILLELGLPTDDFRTLLLLERGQVFAKSSAALRIVRQLSGLWPLLYLGILIPRPLRDALYDLVARHRHRLMGKAGTCRIPNAAERSRFLSNLN